MRAPIVWTMILSMTVLPLSTSSAGPGAKAGEKSVRLQNIELNTAGVVEGRLTDDQGNPIANRKIQIRTTSEVLDKVTDKNGAFTVSSPKGGSCAITVGKQTYACRVWQHKTAPPRSLTSFFIVHNDGPVVRGQYDDCGEGCDDGAGGRFGRIGGVSGGQLLGLGLLAGAVTAIVIAANDDDDAS